MPVVRVCAVCKQARMWSTYGLIHHIMKEHPEYLKTTAVDRSKTSQCSLDRLQMQPVQDTIRCEIRKPQTIDLTQTIVKNP